MCGLPGSLALAHPRMPRLPLPCRDIRAFRSFFRRLLSGHVFSSNQGQQPLWSPRKPRVSSGSHALAPPRMPRLPLPCRDIRAFRSFFRRLLSGHVFSSNQCQQPSWSPRKPRVSSGSNAMTPPRVAKASPGRETTPPYSSLIQLCSSDRNKHHFVRAVIMGFF